MHQIVSVEIRKEIEESNKRNEDFKKWIEEVGNNPFIINTEKILAELQEKGQ